MTPWGVDQVAFQTTAYILGVITYLMLYPCCVRSTFRVGPDAVAAAVAAQAVKHTRSCLPRSMLKPAALIIQAERSFMACTGVWCQTRKQLCFC
jgi:hypothetical protein